jgi:hypothetical protein
MEPAPIKQSLLRLILLETYHNFVVQYGFCELEFTASAEIPGEKMAEALRKEFDLKPDSYLSLSPDTVPRKRIILLGNVFQALCAHSVYTLIVK